LCLGRYPDRTQHIIDRLGQSVSDNFTAPVRGLSIARRGEGPLNMLQRWRQREATDPRDKVYAFMGLFPSTPFPNVQSCRYGISPAELFAKVIRDLIELEVGLRAVTGDYQRTNRNVYHLARSILGYTIKACKRVRESAKIIAFVRSCRGGKIFDGRRICRGGRLVEEEDLSRSCII